MIPDIIITFGDIFSFEGKDYVYLAKTPDLLFAAEILEIETSKKLVKVSENIVRQNNSRIDKPLYCFVILTTAELKDRVAFMGQPQHDDILKMLSTGKRINDHDLQEIKKTILSSNAVPLKLQKLLTGN